MLVSSKREFNNVTLNGRSIIHLLKQITLLSQQTLTNAVIHK